MSSSGREETSNVKSKSGDGVNQFLGVKYATLEHHFAEPEMVIYAAGTPLDATKTGPAVLSPPGAVHMEQSIIQHTLPVTDESISDLDGLNLNITIPEVQGSSDKLMPVFVFIHGGGFNIGCASWPEYDFAKIVKLSAEKGLPAIGVSINYRLGIPGWLTSKELTAAGYKPNRGLRDQRLALKWVQKHIAGFGGDPDNVTLFGESAGGASVTYHMQSDTPLFKRAMIMSGTDLLVATDPPDASEHAYSTALKLLGLDTLDAKDRVFKLANMPGMNLLSKTGRAVHVGPVVDGDTIKHASSYTGVASNNPPIAASTWCDSFMLGDCAFDGSIMSLRIGHKKSNIATTFSSSINSSLGSHAQALLDIYNIDPSTSDDEAFRQVLRFSNDVGFYAPTIAYTKGLASNGKPVYVYHFNEGNPWDGPNKGEANHVLDIAFLFLNYNEYLGSEQKASAEAFAEAFLKFVAGKEPWVEWKEGQEQAAIIESGKIAVKKDVPEEVGRRAEFVKLAEEIGYEKLNEAWAAFADA